MILPGKFTQNPEGMKAVFGASLGFIMLTAWSYGSPATLRPAHCGQQVGTQDGIPIFIGMTVMLNLFQHPILRTKNAARYKRVVRLGGSRMKLKDHAVSIIEIKN